MRAHVAGISERFCRHRQIQTAFFGGEIWFAFFMSAPATYAQKEQP